MAKQPKKRSKESRELISWSVGATFGALLLAVGGALVSYWLMTGNCIFEPEGRLPRNVSEAIRIGLTLAAGVGAAVALVVAFRRQKVLEEDREGQRVDEAADREVQRALHDRYQAATAQLGHDNLTIRLAGVFALAAVADDWLARDDRGQTQVCVDVLCSYLRTDERVSDRSQPDVEVRQTISRVIAAHLKVGASSSWAGLDFDFTGADFTGNHDFSDAVFSGGSVSFRRAHFAGRSISFQRAVFSGGMVSFGSASFTDGHALFTATQFSGGEVSFAGAKFYGAEASFHRSEFSGGEVNFSNMRVDRSSLFFVNSEFSQGQVRFDGAKFLSGDVHFTHSTFRGGQVTFGTTALRAVQPRDGGGVSRASRNCPVADMRPAR